MVKLHGDYRDSRIRNTEEELSEYSDAFKGLLERVLDEYGLVVCGWSATWDRALRLAIKRSNLRYSAWWVDIGPLNSDASALASARQAAVIENVDAELLRESRFEGSSTHRGRPSPPDQRRCGRSRTETPAT